jgi:hypothetical protein
VKQVCVTTAELFFAVDAECVVPNYPAAAAKTNILESHLQLGREIVTYCQPEGPAGL